MYISSKLGDCMTIYIDLILIENIIMNYIIIFTTSTICKEKVKHIRFILASILGAVYVVIQYISNFIIYESEILKLLLAISMIYIAFGSKKLKILLKQLLIFFLTSFCFGGISYYLLHLKIIQENMQNLNNPIKITVLGGVIGFIILIMSFKIYRQKITKKDLIYNIEICYKNKLKKIKVLLDTGNSLMDPITKIPVIIIEKEKLRGIIPKEILNNNNLLEINTENIDEDVKIRCNIIPFKSIGKSNGIIIGFRPDFINIFEDNEVKRRKAIIGIYNESMTKSNLYSGLIGLNMLEECTGSE